MPRDIHPPQDVFENTYNRGRPQLVYSRIVNDMDTPVSAFMKLGLGRPYSFLFESVQGGEQRGRYSFMGWQPDLVWRSFGDRSEAARGAKQIETGNFSALPGPPLDAFRAIQAENEFEIPDGLPPMAAGLFGYLGYDMIRQVEILPQINPDPIGTPDAIMVRPTIVAIFDQILQEIIIASPVYPDHRTSDQAYQECRARISAVLRDMEMPLAFQDVNHANDTVHEPRLGTTRDIFKNRVNRAKAYIEAGDIFQVVIGQRLETDYASAPFSLYRALRRTNPSPFLYFLQFEDHAIVGSSPEILVRLRGDTVTIRPIAGTRPRGKTPGEDIANEKSLLADPKERAEHLMLLDLGRNDVGRVSKSGTVNVTEQFVIERYSHVMHIVSNVEGKIKDGLDTLSALFAGFPAGTVSGAPKVRAMEIIDELEDEKRGIYGGGVGYISCGGDMDTAIVLRTGIIKDGKLHVRAGAGIVADSDPDMEFEETLHKAAAIIRAADHAAAFDRN